MLFQKTFQMPNKLIDHCEDLDPYELYVLAVVIRMTVGYNKPDEFIEMRISDITKTKEKLEKRAVMNRLRSLTERGYLEVRENGKGKPNSYRPAPWLLDPSTSALEAPNRCAKSTGARKAPVREKHRGGASEAPVVVPQKHRGGASEAPVSNKGSLNPSLNPTLNPTANPARAGARAAAVLKLQENRFTAEEAGELVDAHGPEAVMLAIERCDFRAQAVGWKPVRSRREWIRGDLITPGGYEIPEGFISSADRETARRRMAEQEAQAAREREAESAEERRRREEWERYEKIYTSLPPEDRQILHDNAKQFFKAENQFLYHRFTDLEKQGVSPPEMPIGVRAAYLDCRNRLLAERLNEEPIAAES